MNDQSDHSLTPEERALAARLARLGPHGGPSPALDAKILAAARAAAPSSQTQAQTQTRHGRRFVLAGLPASLVTAVGTAAAFVLAVGLVWQLRPVDRPPLPRSAAPGTSDDGFVIAEIVTPRPSAAQPGDPPAAFPEMAASPNGEAAAGTSARRRAPAPGPATTLPDDDGAAAASTAAAPATAAPEATSSPHALDSIEVTGSRAPQRAAASDAFALDEEARAQAAAKADAGIAESAAQRHASYTTAALAKAERASRSRQSIAAAQPAPVAAPAAPAGTATTEPMADIPVELDAKLPPADWLRRVRERRDGGDLEGARASLRRFREQHPDIRIPFDLRRLLR